jgi:Spy/CpxP family protein refolding chaperone
MEFSSNRRKAIALIALVFVLGIAFGAVTIVAGRRVFGAQQRSGSQSRQLDQLTHDLQLTADQQRQFSDIFRDMQAGYDAIRRQMDPQFKEVRQQGRDRIGQILTPEQKTGFEDFRRRSGNRRNDKTPLVNRLTQELHLTVDQQKQLGDILRDTRSRFDVLRQQMNPQIDEVRQRGRDRMRQVLKPEQKSGFENFLRQRDEERARKEVC